MKLIWLILQISWFSILVSIGMGLLSGISSVGLIALINLTLKDSSLPKMMLAWSFVGLCSLLLLSSVLSQCLVSRITQRIVFNLRLRLVQTILASPLNQLETVGTSRLLSVLSGDVETISFASFSISAFGVNLTLLLSCLTYLNYLLPTTSGIGFLFLLFGMGSYHLLVLRGRRFLRLAREEQDQLFRHFQTTTLGIKELQLHHHRQRAFLTEDLHVSAAAARRYRITSVDWFSIAGSWGLLLFFIPIGFLLFGATTTTVPISTLSSYVLTIMFMIAPLRSIFSALPDLSNANIALQKIDALGFNLSPQSTPTLPTAGLVQTGMENVSPWQVLKLVGIEHAYGDDRDDHPFVLGPLHLTFQTGELVFIVGGNGSGKSTLVKLLTGLYIPEAGFIQLDNQPITSENRVWYRQQFAVVFDDFYLFDRLLGLETPDLADAAQQYLAQLQLDHKVTIDQGVFSTTNLSKGQRKRLALLTAYLEDRPIYVFDEWAADQDPVFKAVFYKQLLPDLKHRGKTIFVVTHDDRYFHLADRVVKLEYGQVVHKSTNIIP